MVDDVKIDDAFERRLLEEATRLSSTYSTGELSEAFHRAELQSLVSGAKQFFEFQEQLQMFNIVLPFGRPSLLVQDGKFIPAESNTWNQVLESHRQGIDSTLAGVGRIDLVDGVQTGHVGTGFYIAADIVVTNRHVAKLFSERQGDDVKFTTGTGSPKLELDGEHGSQQSSSKDLIDVIYLADVNEADLALLRTQGEGSTTLALLQTAESEDGVTTVGFPSEEPTSVPEIAEAMARIFGDIFDVKRVAPGKIRSVSGEVLLHDCSTLGNNSGSPVIHISSGKVVGVHSQGRVMANRAVPAKTVDDILQRYG